MWTILSPNIIDLEDIDIISECETLEIVDISNNSIESISPILSLRCLQHLNLSSNKISRLGILNWPYSYLTMPEPNAYI